MLQGIGEEMERAAIRSGIQRGVGAIGKKLGIEAPGKPDGTKQHRFYVSAIIENQGGNGPGRIPEAPEPGQAAAPAATGILGILQKLFGGAAGAVGGTAAAGEGAAAVSMPNWSVGFMAEGGPVSASQAEIVGDQGPELLTRTSGYITRNSELQRMMGGAGGHTFVAHVDARGAEVGVEHRVRRMVDLAHRSAVATAVRAGHERSLRVPQRG
jgi:hypothetical protein